MVQKIEVFPKSNKPTEWIDWMFYLFLGVFTLMTIRGWSGWFLYLTYIITTLAFLVALFARRKVLFLPLMALSGLVSVSEVVFFFRVFNRDFTFASFFGACFTLFAVCFMGYVGFCNFMMWKYYP